MSERRVDSLESFIKEINVLTKNTDEQFVFRGESKDRGEERCVPNLFRRYPDRKHNLEANVLNRVRSLGIDEQSENYILTAIEAQHGGFPSRMLDVSLNSLIALHFAITSHYTKDQLKTRDFDAVVYVIKVNSMVSPIDKKLNDSYHDMITNKESKYNTALYSNLMHFVDFYKKNTRINAQQGAFIIFYGESFHKIPDHLISKIIIDKNSICDIREQLERLFGINNAYVYPEADVLSKTIKKGTFDKFNLEFNDVEEINYIFREKAKSIKSQFERIIDTNNENELLKEIIKTDKLVFDFEFDVNLYLEELDPIKDVVMINILKENTFEMNKRIFECNEYLKKTFKSEMRMIEISFDYNKIKMKGKTFK